MQLQNGEAGDTNQNKQPSEDEDIVQKSLGNFGPWHVWICIALSVVKVPVAWSQLGFVFLAAPMHFQCATSNNSTYNFNDTSIKQCKTAEGIPCTSWVYDRSVFHETIISEWNLVCSRSQLANVAQMILMIGILVGNLSFSVAADRFGRKMPVVFSGVMQMVTGVITALMPWYSGFVFFRFLQAVAVGGVMTVSFVLCMEFLGGKWRTIISSLTHVPFNIGQMTMVVIAYYTREWRHFQMAISVPCILFISYLWLVPESPRWLIAVGRQKEAMKILTEAAQRNNNPIPKEIIGPISKEKEIKDGGNKVGVMDLFRTPNMRKKSLSAFFVWAGCGLCFYGLTQYVSHIGGNIFINVIVSGSLIIPGMLFSIYGMEKFGRRTTLAGGQIITTTSCFLLILFHQGDSKQLSMAEVALGAIGILGCGISFPTLYLFSGELFPTVIRNIGVGSGSVCARVGSMIAPFVASLDQLHPQLPPLAFGTISLIGALVGLLLPETVNCELPQTILEGENYGKKIKKPETNGNTNPGFAGDSTAT
ncbi:organic cation transporter protein-like isoform X2 [Lycorma delicatula]|uniref:organic cation transporter protein-like isoform X2 n=1 Tax=Lycorma delicatula TaxID=130591 RepID=UPI003F50FD90